MPNAASEMSTRGRASTSEKRSSPKGRPKAQPAPVRLVARVREGPPSGAATTVTVPRAPTEDEAKRVTESLGVAAGRAAFALK